MKVSAIKHKYKIVLLGDQHVGKTAIINRFINNVYQPTYNATIGIDFLVKNITYDDKSYRLQLWDTAGQERFKSLIPSYLKDSNCCLIVYDATSPQSVENAVRWLELYNQHKNAKALSFLVGNKIELQDKKCTETIVSQKFKSFKLKHFLVSAKQGTGIDDLFQKVVTQLNLYGQALIQANIERQGLSQKQIGTAQQLMKETDLNNPLPVVLQIQNKVQKRKCCT